MTTLNDLREARDTLINTRRFLYVIVVMVCAAGIFLLISKKASIFLIIFIIMVLIVNFVGMVFQTKGIKGIDDFMVYHAINSINKSKIKHNLEILVYPKKLGIKKKEVEAERQKMQYPSVWDLNESKENYLLVLNKRKLEIEKGKK